MLRKLFSTSSSRPSPANNSFRPRLEALEDRLAPAMTIQQPDFGSPTSSIDMSPNTTNQGSLFAQQTLLAYGLPPSGYALYSLGGAPVGGYPAVPGGGLGGVASSGAITGGGGGGSGGGGASNPVSQVQQLIGALYQMEATQNPQAANSLVMDEIFKAVDTYIGNVAKDMGMNNSSTQGSVSAYQNAINQNPLEQGTNGQLLGSLVYDLTAYLLSNSQTGGF